MTRHPTSQSRTVTPAPAQTQSIRSTWSNMAGTVPVMPWEDNENPPNFLGKDEAAAAMVELGALQPGEKIRVGIARAARAVGFSFTRAFDIHYRKARRIEQFEADAIAAAIDKQRREIARNELNYLKTRVLLMEARLAQIDPEFHRPSIDGLGAAVRGAR